MLELAIIAFALIILYRQLAVLKVGPSPALAPRPSNARLTQLVSYADRLYAEKKWLASEKAYLAVLKIDHKNVTAYSHLGIIYSTQKNMVDAIECFEIAARLKPSALTLQNLGLAYYDNRNYIKSIAAFEKAIMFEPSAARYIGLSKAEAKLHNNAQSLAALEKAAELEPSKRLLHLLGAAYETAKRQSEALETYRRLHELDPTDPEIARKIGVHLPKTSPPA